jgi:hypothetical protein
MENLITSLLVAGLSGLAFLAYRHPPGYRHIGSALAQICLVFVFCALSWNIAVTATSKKLATFIRTDSANAASDAISSLQMPDWLLLCVLLFCYFVLFLMFLPLFTRKHTP